MCSTERGSRSRFHGFSPGIEGAITLDDLQPLVGGMAMWRRPADTGSTDLLKEAEVSASQEAPGQRHPEIIDEPESRAVLVGQYIWRDRFIHDVNVLS